MQLFLHERHESLASCEYFSVRQLPDEFLRFVGFGFSKTKPHERGGFAYEGFVSRIEAGRPAERVRVTHRNAGDIAMRAAESAARPTKRIVLDEKGLASRPATATAKTRTRIDGVAALAGDRLVFTNPVYTLLP